MRGRGEDLRAKYPPERVFASDRSGAGKSSKPQAESFPQSRSGWFIVGLDRFRTAGWIILRMETPAQIRYRIIRTGRARDLLVPGMVGRDKLVGSDGRIRSDNQRSALSRTCSTPAAASQSLSACSRDQVAHRHGEPGSAPQAATGKSRHGRIVAAIQFQTASHAPRRASPPIHSQRQRSQFLPQVHC